MWGRALIEANTIQNFNFGFSTYKSDVLVHLSQWQYWWWFWFTLLWTVYLFFILTLVQRRTYQFNPVINTSIRGHGKWGDFLVALIPLSWCGNILVNSNFILRMIEWQNESSLFTIRVQGKQWYWVYKYDATAAQAILTAPKNIGHNNWFIRVAGESLCADSYYQALQLGAQLEFNQMYLTMLHDKKLNKQLLNLNSSFTQPLIDCDTEITQKNFSSYHSTTVGGLSNTVDKPLFYIWSKYICRHLQLQDNSNSQKISLLNNLISLDFGDIKKLSKNQYEFDFYFTPLQFKNFHVNSFNNIFLTTFNHYTNKTCFSPEINFKTLTLKLNEITLLQSSIFKTFINSTFVNTHKSQHFDYPLIEDTQDFSSNKIETVAFKPLKIFKGILNIHNIDLIKQFKAPITPNFLFVAQFENNTSVLSSKPDQGELIWGFKQKKYKRLQKFIYSAKKEYDHKTFNIKKMSSQKNNLMLKSNLLTNFEGNFISPLNDYHYHKSIKFDRHRSELVPVTLARRLLRTKRTLVLPAHTNITVITNSYDVVHSWFIPGLGLKLDCVPGRSTHHTFYIDNIGFYYGQCAEICGRYHHHMPIRICALPFEQFLIWWQKRGLRRMHRVKLLKNSTYFDSTKIKFRYQW